MNNDLEQFTIEKIKHLTMAIDQSAFTAIRDRLIEEKAMAEIALKAMQAKSAAFDRANAFTDEDLEGMAHGNNPVANAYRELLAFRRAAKQAKPVAWGTLQQEFLDDDRSLFTDQDEANAYSESCYGLTPLYTTPPANSPNGWIKISDRLPIFGEVVITSYRGAINIGEAGISGGNKIYFTSIASGRELPVDFWMALPAGPKPDSTIISDGSANDSCQWNADEDSVYSTECGNEWQFTDGGLEDNQIKFCPYCSGKIAAPKPESE